MYRPIHCSNSSPILELSVKFASQICHENTNKPLDDAYLADFGIDIIPGLVLLAGDVIFGWPPNIMYSNNIA